MSDEQIYECLKEAREAARLGALVDTALRIASERGISLVEALEELGAAEEARALATRYEGRQPLCR